MLINKLQLTFMLVVLSLGSVFAESRGDVNYVTQTKGNGYFTISSGNELATLLVNSNDHAGVVRAVNDLQNDIFNVCGKKPDLVFDNTVNAKNVIIAGTIGQSTLIRWVGGKKND